MATNRYKYGDHLVQCDYSGFICHASETKMTWDGFRVRKDFWEPRHPQDFVRGGGGDPHPVPDARPRTRVYTDPDETVTTPDDL